MLRPLRERDFALLWAGLAVSTLGDGIYLVALAFQAYELDNRPSALALVGVTFTAGMVLSLPIAGLASDRLSRRRVLMASDAVRTAIMVLLGVLSVSGHLELWELAVLVAFFGAAEAFHYPALGPLVADLLPAEQLVQANSLEHFVRPLTTRIAGPVIGGIVVGTFGPGEGFLLDGGTFAISFACLAAMRVREQPTREDGSMFGELRDGLRYVRGQTWLWATLVAASVSLLCFYGPAEVLVPYHVKNVLHSGAGAFGLFLGALGLGWMSGALWMSRREGMPGRPMNFLYLWWGLGTLPLAVYGFTTGLWQLMLLGFVVGAPMAIGTVVWSTLMQTRVPQDLRGRVSSLDWFVSIGLTPVSFALTAPVAAAIGIKATFVLAGVLGGGTTLALLYLVPGLREPSRDTPDSAAGGRRPAREAP